MCLLVCLSSFYRPHDICPLCGAASECPRAAKPSRAAPRERASACTARARARMPYNFSTKKSYGDAFQKQNRTRAHPVVYVTAEIFKKREKENQHATSQVQFTVCLLLECLLFESYWIVLDLWSEPTLVSSLLYKVRAIYTFFCDTPAQSHGLRRAAKVTARFILEQLPRDTLRVK